MGVIEAINRILGFLNKFVDSFLMLQIMYRCFPAKKPEGVKRALWVWIVASTIITYSIDFIVNMNFYAFLALYLIVGLSFGIVCVKGTYYMKVFVALTFTVCSILLRFITSGLVMAALTAIRHQNTQMSPTVAMFSSIFSQILLVILAGFIIKFTVGVSLSLPAQYWIGLILIILADFLSMLFFRNETGIPFYLRIFIMSNVFSVVMMLYYLFSRLTREYEEKHYYLLQTKMLELQSSHLDEITETYNNLRGMRHEMKNHILYMDTLLADNQYEKLHDYFNELNYSSLVVSDIIESGNNVVNAILSQKKAYAASKGIQMHTQTFLPEHIGVKDYELCAVISNLLDNAIEACGDIKNPSIWVDISVLKNYISIIVKNPVLGDVLKQNPELATTKSDRQINGFGIRIIRGIVNRYDGILSFDMREGLFVASAMMKLAII